MPTRGWPAASERKHVPSIPGSDASTTAVLRFVLLSTDAADRSALGGKAHALRSLRRVIPEVPDWFVIRPIAFEASLGNVPALAIAEGSAELQSAEIAGDVLHEIRAGLRRICPKGEPVAVRSSAVEEDSSVASFAGQLESYLNVAHDAVPRRVIDVWRSGFSPRVRAYRHEKGLPGDPAAPAVLVQRMVRADVSGIAFSCDPVSGDHRACVVSATTGLGDRLVAGEIEGDTYHVIGDTVTPQRICSERAVLADEQVRAVAQLARRAECHFECPQDIEWAIERDRLYLLQSRPITTLANAEQADRDGPAVLWDNSNIVESYSGVTSPLTFSFARRIYAAVYRQFGVNLGVTRAVISDHADELGNLLGLVHGRVYYNLLNWYRVLALLPSFDLNRHFLDQMLGVKGKVPPHVLEQLTPPPATGLARLRTTLSVLRTMLAIVGNWLFLQRRITHFYRRLDEALVTPVSEVETMRVDQLAAHYRDLERSLLERWDAPVLNDFYCMIFFGASRHAVRRWGHESGSGLHGEFMQHQGGIISAEPARRIREMANLAAEDRGLCDTLTTTPSREALTVLPDLLGAFDEYMETFGDRCVQELKLESPTLYDDPSTLLRTIGHLAARPDPSNDRPPHRDPRPVLRQRMRGRPLRWLTSRWLLRHAKRHVRQRENLRFERTRIFGRVRRIFVEIGRRLAAAEVIERPEDVFYLELPELLGASEGTLTTSDLCGLARLRRHDAEGFRGEPDPPHRFVTHGALVFAAIQPLATARRAENPDEQNERHGLACSPGVAVGPARVIDDPTGQDLVPGEILVARHTDPGWVLLFAGAAAIVVERGSLLSHSAIVARELGIPAVVSVPEVTKWLRDGDRIEVDGAHGVVRRITDA